MQFSCFFYYKLMLLFIFFLKVATYNVNSNLNIYDNYGNLIQFIKVRNKSHSFTYGLEWHSNDGILISVDAETNDILLWDSNSDTTNFTLVFNITGSKSVISDLQLLDDFTLISSSTENQMSNIIIWNLTSGQIIKQFANEGSVYCIKLLSNRSLLASGDLKNAVNIWDLNSSSSTTPLHTLNNHTDWVFALEVIDENTLASASSDQTVYVWDLTTWSYKIHFTEHSATVWSLKLIDNGIIASGSANGELFIWNTTDGKLLHKLIGHSEYDCIYRMELLSADVLVSVSSESTIRIWNIRTGALLKTLTETFQINSVKKSNSEKIVSSFYSTLLRYSLRAKYLQ